jgi:hypothetical protein
MSFSSGVNKRLWYIQPMEYYSVLKEIRYQAMESHEGYENIYE